MPTPRPVVLCILDGWGQRQDRQANAPALAETPNFDRLMATCPNASLTTHGADVGLPSGQMGNSEVGHTTIGAGRVVPMDLGQINLAIQDGSFFTNPALCDFIAKLQATGGRAHLMGLVSDGGVHGHIRHLLAATKAIAQAGVQVALHVVTDGRDVAPKSAHKFIAELQAGVPKGAFVASVSGRYYAMDRDNRWDRVAQAFGAMVHAKGPVCATALDAVAAGYSTEITDEFLLPSAINGYEGMRDGDGLFCLFFRADRAREILAAIASPSFEAFDTGPRPQLAAMLGLSSYSRAHDAYISVCYPKQAVVNTLGHWVAAKGLKQFRIAETEKYPHVTFFLNGGVEIAEAGEDRFMPKSPPVATYDLQPEMSAPDVTDHLVGAIKSNYDLIVVNYANPDMVGHTGNLDAAIAACEAVDQGLGRVVAALEDAGGAMIVTADHGNCETMIDPETGGAHTAHTTNPVPVIVVGAPSGAKLRSGRLSDLAPTLLALMQIAKPDEMTGQSLLE